jgi:predicted aspartyl protease
MTGQCKVVIKPSITVGRIPTIVESVIPKLFDSDSVILASESIVSDKKKFFTVRLELTHVLTPIIEKVIKGGREVTLGMQLLESGKLKIYQLNSLDVDLPTGDEE